MKAERRKKAESITKKLIGGYIAELPEPIIEPFQLITVKGVRLAPDLSYLDVYVSSLQNIADLPKALAPSADAIERMLAKKVDFLHIPKVRFRPDSSGETLFSISKTLSDVSLGDSE